MATPALLRRFWPYMARYKGILCFDLFCAALTSVCELVLPLIMRSITNMGVNDLSSLTVSYILRVGALYLVLRLIDGAANYFMANTGHVMGARIETDMRRDAFDHLQKLSDSYFANTKVGQIMGRITNDLFDVTEFAHHCPEEFFIAGLKGVISFIILAGMNVWLTLIVFAVVPVMVVCCTRFNHMVRATFLKQRRHIGELNARIEDSLLGERVVKAFGGEDLEREKFEQDNGRFLDIKKETYRWMAAFNTTTRLFDGLMYLVVIVAGGLFMLYGKIEPGDLVAYMLYVTTLLSTIRRIIEFAEQFQRGMTGIERFCEIMDADVDIFDDENAKPLENVQGRITFEHVSFEYPDDHNKVLHDLSLDVRPGEKLALVGPSGGGKTTLCNLIPRFYDVSAGSVTVDGVDVRDIPQHELRDAIGYVPQKGVLFSGDISSNLRYGGEDADADVLRRAAEVAQATEFIDELPDGFETAISQGGTNVSGGQRQRLSIARALVKKAPVYIFDDTFSALDFKTDAKLRKALKGYTEGATVLIVAQRVSTIMHAEQIVVLDEGRVMGIGTHRELLASCKTYREIAESQLSKEELA